MPLLDEYIMTADKQKQSLKNPVFILKGSDTVGLGITKALGKYKIPLFYLYWGESLLVKSKNVQAIKIPSPREDEQRFKDYLLALGKNFCNNGKKGLLFPTDDSSLMLMDRNWKEFSEVFFMLGYPRENGLGDIFNKDLLFQTLEEKLPESVAKQILPQTFLCSNEIELNAMLNIDIYLPCIIKPARKDINYSFFNKFNSKIVIVYSKGKLEKLLKQLLSQGYSLLVQEYILRDLDNNVCFCGYRTKDGRVIAMTRHRVRQFPKYGGTSTFVVAEYYPEVFKAGKKVMETLNAWGISSIEFVRHERDGKYKLLDLNLRCWEQIYHSVAAGQNLPYLAYCDVYNLPLPEKIAPRYGFKWVNALTDARVVLSSKESVGMKIKRLCEPFRGGKFVEGILSPADFRVRIYYFLGLIKKVVSYFWNILKIRDRYKVLCDSICVSSEQKEPKRREEELCLHAGKGEKF